ncbi:regulator of chromosome condensation 1/beta-lactamase-inhibitor protein II [Xylariomycetidae sp. FL0641]|nr:regulator of chromosome condensation 1/beta-lactamase-inhibitor protein II [Xylariomycetidae sp. FL0641]
MTPSRLALRQSSLVCRSVRTRSLFPPQPQWRRYASSGGNGGQKRGGLGKFLAGFVVAFAAAGAVVVVPSLLFEEAPKPREAIIQYEKPRPAPESKEDNRDLLSSQHLQVKNSWEHPGLYAWGSNTGRVAAPDSTDSFIKTPRRIPYFDGQLLRDVKLDRDFGAAITEQGDLVQWGTGYSKANPLPVPTLKGKDLTRIEISRDRIIALGKNGAVYSLPAAASDQTAGEKTQQSSWFSFWTSPDSISYREIKPRNLGWGESVADISGGLEHVLLLTSRGRVFSAASSTSDFPSKGQLGVPGLTFATRPPGPFDQPHEILTLKGFKICQIAAGDYHSLALEKDGRVFVWGDNTSGQLGFEPENEIPFVDGPIPLPFSKIYRGTGRKPQVTSIAAGGANSFFTVDATRIAGPGEETDGIRDLGQVNADTWACGAGIYGSLGTGRWTHVSLGPTKIKPLSGLREYDEKTSSVVPIRLARLSAGSTHSAAVMNNETYMNASDKSSENDTNWGADVVWWGGNEYYQLGTGRRNNVPSPIYIGPLDGGSGDAAKGRAGEEHRFQITPRSTGRLGPGGKGRKVSMEQRVECGRYVTAVYSGT